jgi:hypothetical protein
MPGPAATLHPVEGDSRGRADVTSPFGLLGDDVADIAIGPHPNGMSAAWEVYKPDNSNNTLSTSDHQTIIGRSLFSSSNTLRFITLSMSVEEKLCLVARPSRTSFSEDRPSATDKQHVGGDYWIMTKHGKFPTVPCSEHTHSP